MEILIIVVVGIIFLFIFFMLIGLLISNDSCYYDMYIKERNKREAAQTLLGMQEFEKIQRQLIKNIKK